MRNAWRTSFLAGLAALLMVRGLPAQDEGSSPAAPSVASTNQPYDSQPSSGGPTSLEKKLADEKASQATKRDVDLQERLNGTIWNDLELRAGDPGQLWMFRPIRQTGKRVERPWYMNDSDSLPRVGSWYVRNGELYVTSLNGTVVGHGKYDPDEEIIEGRFIHSDTKQEFGRFRLREETKRNYRVLTMRRDDPLQRRSGVRAAR